MGEEHGEVGGTLLSGIKAKTEKLIPDHDSRTDQDYKLKRMKENAKLH